MICADILRAPASSDEQIALLLAPIQILSIVVTVRKINDLVGSEECFIPIVALES
jgi:hypothetical protein